MQLGIRMLNNNSTLNNLMFLNQVMINPGESATVMFQLVDLDQWPDKNLAPPRYIPISGASITAKITSINTANNLNKIPTNPFVDDRSIFSFTLSSAETLLAAGVNLQITLTESGNIKISNARSVLIMGPQSEFQC